MDKGNDMKRADWKVAWRAMWDFTAALFDLVSSQGAADLPFFTMSNEGL